MLKLPGASLYYEVRGTGPVLLLIPGGPTDAGSFAGSAARLAGDYRVVIYDPRGNSRSSFDGEPDDWRAEVHADDAAALLAAISSDPALVLGSSSGAQVGLCLASRHPASVGTLVAHEPPALELLADSARYLAETQDVHDTYLREGVGPAMAKFMSYAGLQSPPPNSGPPQPETSPEAAEVMARMWRNADLFLAHNARQIVRYVPDVATLRAGPSRIVVGIGEASEGQLAHRCALALADRLGTRAERFPGGHGGFMSDPAPFAARLHQVLGYGGADAVSARTSSGGERA